MEQMLKLSQNTYSTNIALTLELLRIEIEDGHEDLITKMGHSVQKCLFRLVYAHISKECLTDSGTIGFWSLMILCPSTMLIPATFGTESTGNPQKSNYLSIKLL